MSLQIKNRLNTLEATQFELLGQKADKTFTYSRAAIDSKIDPKANQADVYTKGDVDAKINNLINNAPEALNTLNELAQALGDDENYSTTVINLINNKQDKLTFSCE
jgi:hypothetical protein